MGNKFSIGNYVIYCGFPAQRRRFKQREEDMWREQEAKEASEAFQRAEKFKADYPEYCRMAGIKPLNTGVLSQPGMDVENRHWNTNKDNCGWTQGNYARNR